MTMYPQTPAVRRLLSFAMVVGASLSLAACGGDDDGEAQNPLPGPTPTTINPNQPEVLNLPTVDGYLVSATASEVVLKTAVGELTLAVDAQDAPLLGIEHLQSHAGLTTLGFRVYYQQRGSQRFIKRAFEIAPPAFDPG
jgi:hypothetical protein